MIKILVASLNPVKLNATRKGFEAMFPGKKKLIKGIETNSGVNAQPLSDKETLKGAENRCKNASKQKPGYDYYIGIEGGVEKLDQNLTTFAWVVVKSGSKLGRGRTATFFLPKKATEHIERGEELGKVMDRMYNKKNIKQSLGAIGLLTEGIIDRTDLYIPAVICALIPFKKRTLCITRQNITSDKIAQ